MVELEPERPSLGRPGLRILRTLGEKLSGLFVSLFLLWSLDGEMASFQPLQNRVKFCNQGGEKRQRRTLSESP